MIDIQAISKTFRLGSKTVRALHGVSLTIEKGDIYGIIGPSAAGKSTLIRCLSTLASPTSGKILFQGSDIAHMKGPELRLFRQSIGMIFQHFNLLSSRTVAGNIAYPLEIAGLSPEKREERVAELLTLVGLEEKRDAYPALLSGGQKQRVGIARALANEPEVLFCDEATSALDPQTTRDILDLLKKVNEKLQLTLVLITHDMEVIKRICNKVAVIDGGEIVEKGSVEEVFSAPQHPVTQRLIQRTSHEIPEEFFQSPSPNRKLLRLRFKGHAASEPLIAQIVKKFGVEPNILLGWIDKLQTKVVGTLVVELVGTPEGIEQSLQYLENHSVEWEALENGS